MKDKRYVLAEDVLLVPVAELSSAVREKFTHQPTDVALTRRNSRSRSKIVDAKTAGLLRQFAKPCRFVDGVIAYANEQGCSAEEVLNSAGHLLLRLVDLKFLAEEGTPEARRAAPSLEIGVKVAEFEVHRPIQTMDDSEIYAGTFSGWPAALKISRSCKREGRFDPFAHEARVLSVLGAKLGPTLYDAGFYEGRPYLTMEWLEGSSPAVLAKRLRSQEAGKGFGQLVALCCNIANAYADLHDIGVIHGDVHPRNIVIGTDRNARLIDFGLARRSAGPEVALLPRGGVEAYYEPEYARAVLAGLPPPPASFLGEQYALAALIYELMAGVSYLYFSAEQHKMLRQIAEDAPVPFAIRGIFGCSAVQEVLKRALSKTSTNRHPSVRDFAHELREAASSKSIGPFVPIKSPTASAVTDDFVSHAVQRHPDLLLAVLENAPACSVNFGGAGISYALYRIAVARSDPALLSVADLWITRTAAAVNLPNAFYNQSMDLSPSSIGAASLYHGEPGVHCVRALVAAACGDRVGRQEAISDFVRAASQSSHGLDLTIGKSGLLLGAAILLEGGDHEDAGLRALGNGLMNEIWPSGKDALCSKPSDLLGIAHGPAGIVYATLRWLRLTKAPPPQELLFALKELEDMAEVWAGGLRWKRLRRGNDYVPSWCNGTAGFVHLWTETYRATGDSRYLELAIKAGTATLKDLDTRPSLCCGFGGRAYAMLNLFKHTGDHQWYDFARQLGTHSREATGYSLYNGSVGAAVLAIDLAQPERAGMPLFESEC